MQHGINATVAATVPRCAKKVSAAAYYMAVRCNTYEEAYKKWLLPIAHLLPVPLVRPWERTERDQQKILLATSQYTKGKTDPVYFDHRATQASGSVDRFDENARKPQRGGKISPKKRGSRRIPAEFVCQGCGRDVRRAWVMVNGNLYQEVDHDKCMNRRVDTSVLGPKAGMSKKKHK